MYFVGNFIVNIIYICIITYNLDFYFNGVNSVIYLSYNTVK